MIAPFFIAGFDTPSDLCCRIRLYNKGLCPLTPEFIALGFRRSKKEQHQVLLLQTSNNNYGWNKYHAGIFGEVNSTPYPCKSKFKSEVWDNWNLIFQLTPHIEDSDMEELGEQVLGKLQNMTDEEFAEISLEAAE